MDQQKNKIIIAMLILTGLMIVGYWSIVVQETEPSLALFQERVSEPRSRDDFKTFETDVLWARPNEGAVHSSTVQTCTALSDVSVTGPTQGTLGVTYVFTATVTPPTATLPITYTWTPPPTGGSGTVLFPTTHVATYTWSITGTHTLTVTATNCGDTVSQTHTITLDTNKLYLPLVTRSWPPLSWHSQCVDCPRFFDSITQGSIAVDSTDHPHVAYGGDNLYHAWYNGTAWQVQVADAGSSVGDWAAIALDGDNHPHISYYDSGNGDLKYAHWDGSAWISETVDYAGGWDSFIAIDSTGRPHIAYRDAIGFSGTALKYAHWDGSDWQIETIEDLVSTCSSRNNTLALDNDDYPHISYSVCDSGSGDPDYVYHAYLSGSDWLTETIATAEYVGDNALALNSAGDPHIVYQDIDGDTNRLKYAWWDGSQWQDDTLAASDDLIAAISLALDAGGVPHVSYFLYEDYSMRYAHQDGAWQFETVEGGLVGLEMGEVSSLALDGVGQPHVLYLLEDTTLKHARREGSVWQTGTVDQGGDPGRYSFTVLDQAERPHIVYTDQSRRQLKYATWDGAAARLTCPASRAALGSSPKSWQTQAVDQGDWSYAFYYSGLALDGDGYPHVAYSKDDVLWGDTLHYAHWDGSAWQLQTLLNKDVGSASDAAALVLDSAGRPHIVHGIWNGIGHTYWDGATWQSETVDAQAESSSSRLSLTLDDTGRLHLAYWDVTNEALKYAYKDGAGWHVQTVDDEGRSPWLALDSADRPHISYCRIPGIYCDELRYARWDGSQWHISTLESGDKTGFYTSLALDSADRPHISYHNLDEGAVLKYARWDGTAWQIETIDNNEGSGYYTSLVLDSAGRPHISHYDFHAKELRYIWWGP